MYEVEGLGSVKFLNLILSPYFYVLWMACHVHFDTKVFGVIKAYLGMSYYRCTVISPYAILVSNDLLVYFVSRAYQHRSFQVVDV